MGFDMKKLLFVVLSAAFVLGLSSFAYSPRLAITGSWIGQFQANVTDGSIRANFWTEDGEIKGTIDIPSEGVYNVPLSWIIVDSNYVHFELVRDDKTLVFDGHSTGGMISGTCSCRAQRGSFRLMKETLVVQ